MLQMVVVQSGTAALKDTPNELAWLLPARALQLRGVQVSRVVSTILPGTHRVPERSSNPQEPQAVEPWLLLPNTQSTARSALPLKPIENNYIPDSVHYTPL